MLKYVPCNTLKSDSSAPLHCTTEASCSVASSSPGRNLVGVWQREFPSVRHTYDKKEKKTDCSGLSSWQKGYYIFLYSTHNCTLITICTHFTSMHLFLNRIISCRRVEYVHGHACIGSHGDLNMFTVIQIVHSVAAAPVMTFFFTIGSLPSLHPMILGGSPAVKDRVATCHLRSL